MHPTLSTICTAPPDETSLESVLGAAVRKGLTAVALWRERRARYRALSALSDRALKDIGLHRTGPRSAIEESLGRDGGSR